MSRPTVAMLIAGIQALNRNPRNPLYVRAEAQIVEDVWAAMNAAIGDPPTVFTINICEEISGRSYYPDAE